MESRKRGALWTRQRAADNDFLLFLSTPSRANEIANLFNLGPADYSVQYRLCLKAASGQDRRHAYDALRQALLDK